MTSQIDEIVNGSYTDEEKITRLYNKIKSIVNSLVAMHQSLADETDVLNGLMDANGDNADEHHAKTMVFYGRKLSNRDAMLGVKSSDPVTQPPLNVATFTGLEPIISENDYGRIPIQWDCMYYMTYDPVTQLPVKASMSSLYKTEPETKQLSQDHTLGSKVLMPSIQNMNTGGTGAGSNTYLLKSGYSINGWLIDGVQYLYNDTGNGYELSNPNDPTSKIQDLRVFAFGSTSYKLPYNESIKPVGLKFILSVVSVWYNIEFVVRHGTVAETAPCKQAITTRLGNTITLPLATLITMDAGWEIDTSVYPYGQWMTDDPATDPPTPQVDPDGTTITSMEFNAGGSLIVGSDIDAGIRKLYLKIKEV